MLPLPVSDNEALLSVRCVSKRFGGVVAADQVSLEVREGEALGLIGPNGAGKSTLLKLICGEHRPDEGEIRFGGTRTDRLPSHRVARMGVALAHQIPKPFHRLTVRQNLRVGALAASGRCELPEDQHVERILALTGLSVRADAPSSVLGLLDLKRLELARALSLSPRLLLLDEVGAGLVRSELDAMIALIRCIRDAGTTLILVEHIECVIRELADRVCVLDWGRVIKSGTPAAIAGDAEVRELYVGTRSQVADDPGGAKPAHGAPGAPLAELLELEGVSAHYGGARALDDVAVSIRSAEVVAVFGANGAGKTTLAGVVSGLLRPSAGRVLFAGEDVSNIPASQRVELGIAHSQEGRRLFTGLTVRENLEVGAYAPRARRHAARKMEEVFALFPVLGERVAQLAGTLSGGQQQMLAIGRALMSSPRLLILDEASLGLAPIVAAQIIAAVADIRATGTAVLLIEQNVHRSLDVADRVYVLDHGAVSFTGVPRELRGDATLWQAYFGDAGVSAGLDGC